MSGTGVTMATRVGGVRMGIKIERPRRDDRVERILRDPRAYFAEARRAARDEVRAEMSQQQRRGKRPSGTG
jgi:hypothetical protein